MLLKVAADENFDNTIVRGLIRRCPDVDIVRVQDVLPEADDSIVLAWAAEQGRILISHDVKTMRPQALRRAAAGLLMPGAFFCRVPPAVSIGQVVDALHAIVECSLDGEWEGQVRHLPQL